jgi:flagellar hook-associated protein 2
MSSNIGSTGGTGTGSGSGISFSGLGSGIDTNAIVTALMNVERAPINRINRDKTALTSKQSVVQEINTLVTALRDKAASLYSVGTLETKSATSANTAVATAGAATTAAAGTYNVTVTSLAASHTMATAASPALTAGQSLDVTVGAGTVSVAVNAGDTLQTFADRINGTSGAGASASVVNNRLVLVSKTGGAGGTISLGGTAAGTLGFATTQAGSDAAATVNGIAVTGGSNVINGAIGGVDLSLAGLGTTTISVGTDTAAIQTKVQEFVDAYNKVISTVNTATAYNPDTKARGTLQGDTMMTGFAGAIRGIAGSSVSGIPGAYDSLASIGINSSRSGELTLDTGRLQTVLSADPSAVQRVFGHDDGTTTGGPTDGVGRQIREFANNFSTSAVAGRLTGYTTSLTQMSDKITSLESLMTLRQTRLRQQFQAMETAVSRLNAQGSDLAARLGR